MNGLAVLLMRIHEITQEADHHHTIDLDTNRIAMLKQNNKAFLDDNSILFMQLLPVNTYLAQNVDELKRMNERAFAIAKKVDKLSRFIRAQNSEASGFFSGLFGYSCQTHLDTRAFDTQRQTLRNRVRDLSTQGKNMIEYWARVEACHPQIKAPSKKSQDLHAYERLKKMVSLGVITPTDLLTIADDVNFNKFLDNKLNPEAKALSELVEWTRENCHN